MPTPPPADVIDLPDTSLREVESRAELDRHLARRRHIGMRVTLSGMRNLA